MVQPWTNQPTRPEDRVYNTEKDSATKAITAHGNDVVHFDYNKATGNPNVAVGTGDGKSGVILPPV